VTARLEYGFEPLSDLYLLLTDPRSIPADGWSDATEAMRPILTSLEDAGSLLGMIVFHGAVAEATGLEELEALHGRLTDADRDFGLPWRDLIGRAIDALRVAIPLYERDVADARRDAVTAASTVLDERLGPHADACFAFMESSLELPADGVTVPVRLVASSFWPGMFTSRSLATGAICFVGVAGLAPTTLIEMVLHEAIHALDEVSPRATGSVLRRLDAALERAGLAGDPRFEQVTHSLYFVQAAETVRRIVDAAHVDYGVTHTYYERVPGTAPVRENWVAHLDGASDADTAIERIAADLAAGRA
jgi:hypothetical protein